MDVIAVVLGLFGSGLALFGGLCAFVVPVLLLAGVGYLLYRRNKQAGAANSAAQSWPHTSGTVLQSSVHRSTSGKSVSIYPVVVYQYSVDGKKYQSQNIKAGDKFMSIRVTGEAQRTVDRYPVGERVKVYYNPANPKESALER